jgi:hypothetical protein
MPELWNSHRTIWIKTLKMIYSWLFSHLAKLELFNSYRIELSESNLTNDLLRAVRSMEIYGTEIEPYGSIPYK